MSPHGAVAAAIKRGALPRLDGAVRCADCAAPAQVYDHRDYDRPLEVEPVCRSCNTKRGPAAGRKYGAMMIRKVPRWVAASLLFLAKRDGLTREQLIRRMIKEIVEARCEPA